MEKGRNEHAFTCAPHTEASQSNEATLNDSQFVQ